MPLIRFTPRVLTVLLPALLVAAFFLSSERPPEAGPVSSGDALESCDHSADVGFPIAIELEGSLIAGADRRGSAAARIQTRLPARRVEVEFRPSRGIRLEGPSRVELGALSVDVEKIVDLGAVVEEGFARGTVDIVVTAWIEDAPVSRGATWNLIREESPPGRRREREGRLPVREFRVGSAER